MDEPRGVISSMLAECERKQRERKRELAWSFGDRVIESALTILEEASRGQA
jgi:hypothetical protein